jgi:hypothetical protein
MALWGPGCGRRHDVAVASVSSPDCLMRQGQRQRRTNEDERPHLDASQLGYSTRLVNRSLPVERPAGSAPGSAFRAGCCPALPLAVWPCWQNSSPDLSSCWPFGWPLRASSCSPPSRSGPCNDVPLRPLLPLSPSWPSRTTSRRPTQAMLTMRLHPQSVAVVQVQRLVPKPGQRRTALRPHQPPVRPSQRLSLNRVSRPSRNLPWPWDCTCSPPPKWLQCCG